MRLGSVALVGAGPGRAEFLTLAALRAIQGAEVILYDALLAADVLELFPAMAKAVYVGKRCGRHALKQSEINELIASYARAGYRVVRLKGGDPFIFGRGAEEVEVLRLQGIPYRIIPGLSALNGIAGQLALPLTLRTGSNEFRVIQGHSLPHSDAYWQGLAVYEGTLVIFMGIDHIQEIVARILAHGGNKARPVAVIESEDNEALKVSKSDLGQILVSGFSRKSCGPGIIYIGENVAFMEQGLATAKEVVDAPAVAHFS